MANVIITVDPDDGTGDWTRVEMTRETVNMAFDAAVEAARSEGIRVAPAQQESDVAVETQAVTSECFATTTGNLLCWQGRNYVPQDHYIADVRKLQDVIQELETATSARSVVIERQGPGIEKARAELIEYVRAAFYSDPTFSAEHFQGMINVLAKFLVAVGEVEPDEAHARAYRLIDSDANHEKGES